MSSILALIDCNNFFVSCERVFNPKLEKKAVVVLSSNDGCIVSRSAEAKALGIKMGAPVFEYRDLFRQKKVITLSSNFSLYGDMSNRVMESLQSFGFLIHIYSIDEAFVELPELPSQELTTLGQEIRSKIKKWTGIPTAIGIGKTKTLAKAANEFAKKQTGVALAITQADREALLPHLPVEDVWGIGKASASFLREYGIMNAQQLQASPDDWIRKHLTVGGLRTVLELRGIPSSESIPEEKIAQSLVCSRSFGRHVVKFEELAEAVSHHAARAGEKLRAEGLCTTIFGIFIGSGHLKSESASSTLPFPTAETPTLIAKARQILALLYKKGASYKKAGVFCAQLVPQDKRQSDLFAAPNPKKEALMQTLDEVNGNFGRGALFFAAEGIDRSWKARSSSSSPHYTSRWDEIPLAKCED